MRKNPSFRMRFEVTSPTISAAQKAEASVRLTAPSVDTAIRMGRAKLAQKGFTVGRCTDVRTKLNVYFAGDL